MNHWERVIGRDKMLIESSLYGKGEKALWGICYDNFLFLNMMGSRKWRRVESTKETHPMSVSKKLKCQGPN